MDEYQGYFADCYVLSNQRTEVFINQFLKHFFPKCTECTDTYEMQCFTDQQAIVFQSATEAIKHLEKNNTIEYSLYWSNVEPTIIRGAELFFTNDGYLIVGIYCETKYPNTEIEDNVLLALKRFCNSDEGYITYETSPPLNSVAFTENVKNFKLVKNGKI